VFAISLTSERDNYPATLPE